MDIRRLLARCEKFKSREEETNTTQSTAFKNLEKDIIHANAGGTNPLESYPNVHFLQFDEEET